MKVEVTNLAVGKTLELADQDMVLEVADEARELLQSQALLVVFPEESWNLRLQRHGQKEKGKEGKVRVGNNQKSGIGNRWDTPWTNSDGASARPG